MNARKQGVFSFGPEDLGGTSRAAVVAVTVAAPVSIRVTSPLGERSQDRGDQSEEALGERLSPLHSGKSAGPRR